MPSSDAGGFAFHLVFEFQGLLYSFLNYFQGCEVKSTDK